MVRSVARVVARYPHDRAAFTQGLLIEDGRLYEGTGNVGSSSLREVELHTGRVLRQRALPAPHFGEGIAVVGREVFQLTWRSGRAFVFDLATFEPTRELRYAGEGWGLATLGDALVMSDGTPTLRFFEPRDLRETRRVQVTRDGRLVRELNALCVVDGTVLANVWHRDVILRIDPETGCVTEEIDVSQLARPFPQADVTNGIAWNATERRLFVTGKNWPTLFEVVTEQP